MSPMDEKWFKRLKQLVAVDTTNPPGRNYNEALRLLEPWCKEAGFKVEKVKIPSTIAKNRVNLLAHRRQPGRPRLLAYSHIDVVPADADWQPFQPRRKRPA